MTRVSLLILLTACSTTVPAAVVPVVAAPTTDLPPTEPFEETVSEAIQLETLTGPLSGRLDMIYALARLDRWIVAGTQGGVVVWDKERGAPIAMHDEFICNSLVVAFDSVWAGCDKHVLQWDPSGWKEHLANDENDADYYQLVVGSAGELHVVYGGQSWISPAGRSFSPSGSAITNSYSAVFHGEDLWAVDFMSGIRGPNGFIAIGSPTYPGRDPRRLRVDELGRLWVEDFGAGLYRWESGQFAHESGISNKGAGVAVDAHNDRTWMLHYTDGLTVKESGQIVQTVDLSDLGNMRDLLLDSDGSVWVGSWAGLTQIRVTGTEVNRRVLLVPR